MRQDGKPQTAWQRDNKAEDVFRELGRREMRDLETCRQVWEQESDPLALCEAIRQTKLPDWLANALLHALTDGVASNAPSFLRRLWQHRTRDANDAERAAQIAMLRSHPEAPQTWETACVLADHFARERYDISAVGPAMMKRAYKRVCDRLWKHPTRYYRARPGMHERIRQANVYMLALMEEALSKIDASRKSPPGAPKK